MRYGWILLVSLLLATVAAADGNHTGVSTVYNTSTGETYVVQRSGNRIVVFKPNAAPEVLVTSGQLGSGVEPHHGGGTAVLITPSSGRDYNYSHSHDRR